MFELQVVSNIPLTSVSDADLVAEQFLSQIGYIPKGYDPKTAASNIRESIPYRLFMEYFMGNTSRLWSVEELAYRLETSKPTVYRHINKLKALELLESGDVEFDGQIRKGYRIRYGDLSKAWNFTRSNVEMAMENYTKTVEHFQTLMSQRQKE